MSSSLRFHTCWNHQSFLCTKPDSGIAALALIFLITNEANSFSGMSFDVKHNIEPFSVTVVLQRGLHTSDHIKRTM